MYAVLLTAALAVPAMELADPREGVPDAGILFNRAVELADAPYLSDAVRLPDRELAMDALTLNRQVYAWLVERRAARDWAVVVETTAETEQLWAVWDAIRDARTEYYFVTPRRRFLRDVRRLVGERAYYAGVWPPPVPLWRFDRAD